MRTSIGVVGRLKLCSMVDFLVDLRLLTFWLRISLSERSLAKPSPLIEAMLSSSPLMSSTFRLLLLLLLLTFEAW